jgi:hypothetical protein
MTARDDRLQRNQRQFRYANERLTKLVGNISSLMDDQLIPFLCECANDRCFGRIEATLGQYEDAHLLGNDYFILSGHPRIENEEIVEMTPAYDVVRKG